MCLIIIATLLTAAEARAIHTSQLPQEDPKGYATQNNWPILVNSKIIIYSFYYKIHIRNDKLINA